MNKPCKHGHFNGALHEPCYQCRSEAYADDIAELERTVENLRAELARSQEETVRRCEQAIEKLSEELYAAHGNVDPETGANELPVKYMDIAEAYDSCKAAILVSHGLKEKTGG